MPLSLGDGGSRTALAEDSAGKPTFDTISTLAQRTKNRVESRQAGKFSSAFFFSLSIFTQRALSVDGVSGGSTLTKKSRDNTPIGEAQAVRGRVPNVGPSSRPHAECAELANQALTATIT